MAKVGRTNLIQLIDWMRKNREMCEDPANTMQDLARFATSGLGFNVPWRTIPGLIKDLGFERGDKVAIQTTKFVARLEYVERSLAEVVGHLYRASKKGLDKEKWGEMQDILLRNSQS